jgi:hypothetical protein
MKSFLESFKLVCIFFCHLEAIRPYMDVERTTRSSCGIFVLVSQKIERGDDDWLSDFPASPSREWSRFIADLPRMILDPMSGRSRSVWCSVSERVSVRSGVLNGSISCSLRKDSESSHIFVQEKVMGDHLDDRLWANFDKRLVVCLVGSPCRVGRGGRSTHWKVRMISAVWYGLTLVNKRGKWRYWPGRQGTVWRWAGFADPVQEKMKKCGGDGLNFRLLLTYFAGRAQPRYDSLSIGRVELFQSPSFDITRISITVRISIKAELFDKSGWFRYRSVISIKVVISM